MAKVGRPTKYTQELADKICEQLALGKSMRTVVKENNDIPAMSTIFLWLRKHKDFSEQYEKAKQEASDALVDEMQAIADNEVVMITREDGSIVPDSGSVQHARLRIDTRKWIASKLKPKKYGDRVDVTTDGEKLPAPIIPLNVQRDNSDQEDNSSS